MTSLDNEFAERRKLLEAEVERKRVDVATKEAELIQQRSEIDDLSSRDSRRKLREAFKNAIRSRNENFQLTKSTRQTRYPIHGLYILMVLAFGLFACFALWEQFNHHDSALSWLILIRVPISILAFAATIIYYIRWNDQWFQQYASEELRLKRLDLDIDRASWLVEMIFEWKDEKGTEIPKELVGRLSRNLFATRDEVPEYVKHPTQEALSRVLGTLSSLQVQIPGLGEATIGRRGLTQLRKAAKEDEG